MRPLPSSSEAALLALLEEDRAENRRLLAGEPAYVVLRERDAARRERARDLLAADPSPSPSALYAAAWLLNHGDRVEEAQEAHRLAVRAAEGGVAEARWLAAAALDRSLMYAGKPQRFGTNIVPDGRGQRVWDVDPQTTDEERARWDVPPLAELHARAARLSESEPFQPLDDAPDWLKAAAERWRREEG